MLIGHEFKLKNNNNKYLTLKSSNYDPLVMHKSANEKERETLKTKKKRIEREDYYLGHILKFGKQILENFNCSPNIYCEGKIYNNRNQNIIAATILRRQHKEFLSFFLLYIGNFLPVYNSLELNVEALIMNLLPLRF